MFKNLGNCITNYAKTQVINYDENRPCHLTLLVKKTLSAVIYR